jgi:hypothetical protein
MAVVLWSAEAPPAVALVRRQERAIHQVSPVLPNQIAGSAIPIVPLFDSSEGEGFVW